MTKNTRFSPEVRQRAVRMVLESQSEYDSQWATICSIAPKIGCTPETLRVWVRQHERDTGGGDGGLTTAERQRLKELERENRHRYTFSEVRLHRINHHQVEDVP
ncbi:transposase [Escherichia coli]|nr:transposase [Escherichia coli]